MGQPASTIPVHYGFSGQPDAWGGKIELLELPVVSVLLYFGLTLLARYPHKFNYPGRSMNVTPNNNIALRDLWSAQSKSARMVIRSALVANDSRGYGSNRGLGGAFVPVILE